MSKLKEWLRSKEMERMYSLVADSQGVQHLIAHQRRLMSCCIACCAMVMARVRGIRLEESALRSYSKCFYQGPNTDTAAYDFRSGTEIRNMAVMLGKMCVPITYKDGGRTINNVQRASMKTPIIGLVNWNTAKGAGGGGGHFVVIDSSDANGNAVICDPWYGLVECDVSNGGYVAKSKHKAVFSGCWIFTDGKPA